MFTIIYVTDLEQVIAMKVLPMKASSANQGRVTQAMAYMLYAEIVMYQNDEARYATALNYMKEIIADGSYDLVSDYASIWEESGEWSKESIWEINYKDDNAARSWGNPQYAGGTVLPRLISPNGWADEQPAETMVGVSVRFVKKPTNDMRKAIPDEMLLASMLQRPGHIRHVTKIQDFSLISISLATVTMLIK
jgi:hypothetical protein